MNKTSIRSERFEWTGPDFGNNCYSDARYRSSSKTVRLDNIDVLANLEVLNKEDNWQRHPVVFIHYGNYESLKNGEGNLIIFLPNGKWTSCLYSHLDSRYRLAEKIGLTRGIQSGIKPILRREE